MGNLLRNSVTVSASAGFGNKPFYPIAVMRILAKCEGHTPRNRLFPGAQRAITAETPRWQCGFGDVVLSAICLLTFGNTHKIIAVAQRMERGLLTTESSGSAGDGRLPTEVKARLGSRRFRGRWHLRGHSDFDCLKSSALPPPGPRPKPATETPSVRDFFANP